MHHYLLTTNQDALQNRHEWLASVLEHPKENQQAIFYRMLLNDLYDDLD
jgi:hypothetical protein